MNDLMALANRPIFSFGGVTVTLGMVLLAAVAAYFLFFRRR